MICNPACIEFVKQAVRGSDASGREILEVGALDVNGSVRPEIEAFQPASYVGVDIEPGSGVDEVCDVANLVHRFGLDSFDLVVSTEMVEHVSDWRTAFNQMKLVLRSGGLLVVTTRSPGFPVHAYPFDYWRYTAQDMRAIFSDFDVRAVEPDTLSPGIFVAARKPEDWGPADLSRLPLYSVAARRPLLELGRTRKLVFPVVHKAHVAYRAILPERVRLLVGRRQRSSG